MTADEIRTALRRRWPDGEYLTLDEVPTSSDRQGRRLDFLAIAVWRSRGLQLDGVEIKVTLSDWKRELKDGGKAEFWWRHVHRFWIAVPGDLVDTVRPDLPHGWGLLGVYDTKGAVVASRAETRKPEPLSWGATVGLLRAAASAGQNALWRANEAGRREGLRQGRAEAERATGSAYLDELRDNVREFERISGLKLRHANEWKAVAQIANLIRKEMADPGWMAQSLVYSAEAIASEARRTEKQAKEVVAAAKRIQDLLTEEASSEQS